MKKTLQIIGPFISNYSLARVNRGLAVALSKLDSEYDVSIFQYKDRFERYPSEEDLKKFPEIAKIWRKDELETDIVIYNDFPKDGYTEHGLQNLPGKIKLMYLAWEESVYPEMWVNEINENLHGMIVASSFVREILRRCGVKVPISVVPNAIDENILKAEIAKFNLDTDKSFKFLHVSTGRRRKGIDVLIKAYCEEFSKDDDVCLVIKSFPGPENMVNELIDNYKNENSPEILHIFNSELTDKELANLTASCDCAVYPSRAEGFGLPIAEAMYLNVPVIATNYSAYLDFLNDESGFLIDYELKDAIDSEMLNIGAKWAEPDGEDLRKKMRNVYDNRDNGQKSIETQNLASLHDENTLGDIPGVETRLIASLRKPTIHHPPSNRNISNIISTAHTTASQLTWQNSAIKTFDFVNQIKVISELKNNAIAVVGKLNSEDGVAEYTTNIFNKIENSFKEFYYLSNKDIDDRVRPDAENVFRTWNTGETGFEETINFINDRNIDIVNIQYHSGSYYSFESLENLIVKLKELNKVVYLTLHAVKGPTFDFVKQATKLHLADKIIIHNINDFEYAKSKFSNFVLFRIPVLEFKRRDRSKLKNKLGFADKSPIISSHGLMNSNKNISNIVEAIAELKGEYPNIHFLAINAVSANNLHSGGEYNKAVEAAKRLGVENNVTFITDFLDIKQIEILLQSADINIFAYTEVGESASESVRKCLASINPTIVTDIKMFSEFDKEVLKIKDESPANIAEGIRKVLQSSDIQNTLKENTKKFIEENSTEKQAVEMMGRWKGK